MVVLDRLTVDLFRRGADGRLWFKPYHFGAGYLVPSAHEHHELHRELRHWYAFYAPFAIFMGVFALAVLPDRAPAALAAATVVVLLYVMRMHYVIEELRRVNHKASGPAGGAGRRIHTAADEHWRWS